MNGAMNSGVGSTAASSFRTTNSLFTRTTGISLEPLSYLISWQETNERNNLTAGASPTVLNSMSSTLYTMVNVTVGNEMEQNSLSNGGYDEDSSTGLDISPITFPEDGLNNGTDPSVSSSSSGSSDLPGKSVIIPLYTMIFFLSFIGNLMVILTLARNRRMRTVTNVLLLNLAVSDLLLGVFCMPVTLIGQLLRNFIFGDVMCRLLPYFQAVSVSVGVWTLVAISLERYFAICRPLQSRKWQTRSHAYKMILSVWLFTLTWNLPITFVSTLQPIRNSGRFKCREIWPSAETEKVFNLVLDFLLLLIPLCIMGMAYSLIVSKLWKGLQSEIRHTRSFRQHGPHGQLIPREESLELTTHCHFPLQCKTNSGDGGSVSGMTARINSGNNGVGNEILTLKGGKGVVVRWKRKNAVEVADTTTAGNTSSHRMNCGSRNSLEQPHHHHHHNHHCNNLSNHSQNVHQHNGHAGHHHRQISNNLHHTGISSPPQVQNAANMSRAIRSTYTGKSMESKKKVIRMLFVLVFEFFACWTPLYVMNTWYLFDSEAVYNNIGPFGVVLIQLLAYASSCCNPITYCFMNRKFRNAFIKVFQCTTVKAVAKAGPQTLGRGSDMSANDSLIYGAAPSTLNKSVLVLECENRV